MSFTESKDGFIISTDNSKLDIAVIHQYLSLESYWAKNIPLQIVTKSIEGALCFGLYDAGKQIGFARVITDYATFGYLADVFILTDYRGSGCSARWMHMAYTGSLDSGNWKILNG
jgi:hypothetical protein